MRSCQCPTCQGPGEHPDKLLHHRINLFLDRLDEQQRRWYVAIESLKPGYGGDTRLSQITGLDVETIRRGRRELEAELAGQPTGRVRAPGGGRPAAEKKG
jgi:hypothetical protein